VIFRQITHDDLGCASYLVGDEQAGVAAVVDPKLDIDEYLRLARYFGVAIEHVLETHTHADHVSGHGRLAAATGATIHVHEAADPRYDHERFADGWQLELGSIRLQALHTPGHRPEHTAFAVVDLRRGEEPWAVLTGDSLFVGDIARPDLAVDKEEGARGIFHSLHGALLTLPDSCEVWPGHLGGSMCGGPGMDLKVSSTIGFERAHQALLAVHDEDEFVRRTTAALGPQPPNFRRIVELNRGPLLRDRSEAHPLAPRQVVSHQRDGGLVVDVRTELQFDEAHVPGAVCITALRGGFGSKLAWLAEHDQPVVLVGRADEDARAAVELAAAVGITNVAGFLAGGMTSWREERLPVDRIERLSVTDLHDRWEGEDAPQILDVREQREWDGGHIPGSTHVPYHDVRGVPDGLDAARPIAVVCASASAPPSRPACCSATARATSCTWSRAACRSGSDAAGRSRPEAARPSERPALRGDPLLPTADRHEAQPSVERLAVRGGLERRGPRPSVTRVPKRARHQGAGDPGSAGVRARDEEGDVQVVAVAEGQNAGHILRVASGDERPQAGHARHELGRHPVQQRHPGRVDVVLEHEAAAVDGRSQRVESAEHGARRRVPHEARRLGDRRRGTVVGPERIAPAGPVDVLHGAHGAGVGFEQQRVAQDRIGQTGRNPARAADDAAGRAAPAGVVSRRGRRGITDGGPSEGLPRGDERRHVPGQTLVHPSGRS
jgi:glyoxylase-like metal-dependent hydrolase (beta-lactamase superfamily II)/rhodanese-related sulfurtransferase